MAAGSQDDYDHCKPQVRCQQTTQYWCSICQFIFVLLILRTNRGKKPRIYKRELINSYDIATDTLNMGTTDLGKTFGIVDMYKDDGDTSDVYRVEKAFSKLESDAARVFQRLDAAESQGWSSVELVRLELNTIRKFLFLMHYRNGVHARQFINGRFDPSTAQMVEDYRVEHGLPDTRAVWLRNIALLLEDEHWEVATDERLLYTTRMDYKMDALDKQIGIYRAPPGTEFILTENGLGLAEGASMPSSFMARLTSPDAPESQFVTLTQSFPITPRLLVVLRSVILTQEAEMLRQGYSAEEARRYAYAGLSNRSYFDDIPRTSPKTTYIPALPPNSYNFMKPRQLMTAGDRRKLEDFQHHGLLNGEPMASRVRDRFVFPINRLREDQAQRVNTLLLTHCHETISFLTPACLLKSIEVFEDDLQLSMERKNRYAALKVQLKAKMQVEARRREQELAGSLVTQPDASGSAAEQDEPCWEEPVPQLVTTVNPPLEHQLAGPVDSDVLVSSLRDIHNGSGSVEDAYIRPICQFSILDTPEASMQDPELQEPVPLELDRDDATTVETETCSVSSSYSVSPSDDDVMNSEATPVPLSVFTPPINITLSHKKQIQIQASVPQEHADDKADPFGLAGALPGLRSSFDSRPLFADIPFVTSAPAVRSAPESELLSTFLPRWASAYQELSGEPDFDLDQDADLMRLLTADGELPIELVLSRAGDLGEEFLQMLNSGDVAGCTPTVASANTGTQDATGSDTVGASDVIISANVDSPKPAVTELIPSGVAIVSEAPQHSSTAGDCHVSDDASNGSSEQRSRERARMKRHDGKFEAVLPGLRGAFNRKSPFTFSDRKRKAARCQDTVAVRSSSSLDSVLVKRCGAGKVEVTYPEPPLETSESGIQTDWTVESDLQTCESERTLVADESMQEPTPASSPVLPGAYREDTSGKDGLVEHGGESWNWFDMVRSAGAGLVGVFGTWLW